MELEHLNDIGLCRITAKKISELEMDVPYAIKSAKRIDKLEWASVLLELEIGCAVFLPSRIAAELSDNAIKRLPQFSIIPKGTKNVGKKEPAQLVEFVPKST